MKKENKIVCFIIDDEPKALKMIERLLEIVVPEWERVSFNSPKQLIAHCKIIQPNVLFSDIEMPELSGFKLLDSLKEMSIYPMTVFITGFDHYAIRAIKEEVLDYLVKPVDIDDLQQAVDRVKAKLFRPAIADQINKIGELTPTEKDVLKLLAKGCTSAETAGLLNSSPHTINTHRNHILRKMDCSSILEVVNELQKR